MNILHNIITPPAPLESVFKPVQLKQFVDLRAKNIEIAKVYTCIVAELRGLLAKMNTKEHRTYILSSNEVKDKYEDNVLFEFTCVMCELRLSIKHYAYYLELDTDSDIKKVIGGYTYRKMLRAAYRNTSYDCTHHDLEDCISIETNMQGHLDYFLNRVKSADSENSMVIIEDTNLSWNDE